VIRLKRIYDPASSADGFRVLVDRLWPRGISKERATLDLWLRDVAPSDELRRWYAHDPERWPEFQRRYRQELAVNPAIQELRDLARSHPVVTLLFAARDSERNEAVALAALIEDIGSRHS
jgi:uncharacterized protein YeaO (DUF488 family)